MHKRFELRQISLERRIERAVLTTDIAREGKVVDRVYLYVVRQGGHWLIDGIDENRGHIEPFLAQKVPASFVVDELPQNAALLQLGALIIDAANEKPGAHDKLYAQVTDTSSVGYLHLHELRGATCKAAYFSEPLASVALVFEKPGTDGASPEVSVLYLHKQQAMWHVYAGGHGSPSARAMLPQNQFYLKAPPSTQTPSTNTPGSPKPQQIILPVT